MRKDCAFWFQLPLQSLPHFFLPFQQIYTYFGTSNIQNYNKINRDTYIEVCSTLTFWGVGKNIKKKKLIVGKSLWFILIRIFHFQTFCVHVWMSVYPANTYNLKFWDILGIVYFHLFICFHTIVLCIHHVLLGNGWKKFMQRFQHSVPGSYWGCVTSGWSCVRGKNAGPMPLILCLWERYQNQEWVMIGQSL